MTTSACDHLDSYIGGWLAAVQRAAFEDHLRDCRLCQAELSRQGRIDDLLAMSKTQLEPVPPLLMRRIRRQLEWCVPRRAVHWLPASLSAAAALLLVLTLRLAQREPVRVGEVRPATEMTGPDGRRGNLESRRAALGQLAILCTSLSEAGRANAHPWLRLPTIPAPLAGTQVRGRLASGLGVTERFPRAAGNGQEVQITRGPPPFNARSIYSRLTLGQRKLGEGPPGEPDAGGGPGHNGSGT